MNKLFIPLLGVCIMLVTACSNKRLVYFNQPKPESIPLVSKNYEPLIQKGDILAINVVSLDPQSSLLFSSAAANGGIMVDNNGTIAFPKLGLIQAMGKTKYQLTNEIQGKLQPYLKEPAVTIRFMNFRITVIGEVGHPGTILIPNDRVNILEAIGLAGDLTNFAKRDNILLMREINGKQEFHPINLLDNSIFSSPDFYLQSNDVLYVVPNNAKAYSGTSAQAVLPAVLGIVSITLSLGFIILNNLK